MIKTYNKVTVVILFFIIIGIVVYLYNYANNIPINFQAPDKSEVKEHKFFSGTNWLSQLSDFKQNSYIEPVNTMLINIKLVKLEPKKVVNSKKEKKKKILLEVKNSSEYSTFCLVQVLDSLNLEYHINKKDYISSVFIKIKEDKMVNVIKSKLKKLNVNVQEKLIKR